MRARSSPTQQLSGSGMPNGLRPEAWTLLVHQLGSVEHRQDWASNAVKLVNGLGASLRWSPVPALSCID
jgi:hypothetical protein